MFIVIIVSVVLYLILTGIAIYMSFCITRPRELSKLNWTRRIVGLFLVGWLVTLFYGIFVMSVNIIDLLDSIFNLELN